MLRNCRQRSALQVFTTLALVGMLIIPLNSFPWVLNSILEAKVSLDRIQQFFKLTNRDLQTYYAQGVMLFYHKYTHIFKVFLDIFLCFYCYM